jgi:hypothetical protein
VPSLICLKGTPLSPALPNWNAPLEGASQVNSDQLAPMEPA